MPGLLGGLRDERTEPVSVEFELTPEESVEASLEHSSKSPQVRRAMRNVRLLFVALIVLATLISLRETDRATRLDRPGTDAYVWTERGAETG